MSLLRALKLPTPPAIRETPSAAGKAGAEGRNAASGPKADTLLQAADAWRQTLRQADERIAALKGSVKSQCADSPAALLQAIDKGLVKLDEVLSAVDHRLADSLANAGKAADGSARTAELKKAKSILAQYLAYVNGAPIVAHLDRNPFGVKTEVKALLASGLTRVAKAIG